MTGVIIRRSDRWFMYGSCHWLIENKSLRTRSMYCFDKKMWVPLSKIIVVDNETKIVNTDEELEEIVERVSHAYDAMQIKIREARDIFNMQLEMSV